MAQHKLIKSNRARFATYVGVGVVMAAVIVATLVEVGVLTDDQIDSWITRVGLLVVAFLGLGQSILSAMNVDKDDRDEVPAGDPGVGH